MNPQEIQIVGTFVHIQPGKLTQYFISKWSRKSNVYFLTPINFMKRY